MRIMSLSSFPQDILSADFPSCKPFMCQFLSPCLIQQTGAFPLSFWKMFFFNILCHPVITEVPELSYHYNECTLFWNFLNCSKLYPYLKKNGHLRKTGPQRLKSLPFFSSHMKGKAEVIHFHIKSRGEPGLVFVQIKFENVQNPYNFQRSLNFRLLLTFRLS